MIRGITFDKQLMKSKDHAHEVNYYYGGDLGVTKGCDVTENIDGNLVVSAGYFIIKGRLVAVEGTEVITVPVVASGTLFSTLIFEIDLTKTNTAESFLQGAFKIVSNAVAYPALTQEDLDDGGDVYQFEFARFENTVDGVGSLTDTRVLLDLGKYATTSTYNFTLSASSWTGTSAPFSKSVTVNGIVSTDEPIIDLALTGTYATDLVMLDDWSRIYRVVSDTNTLTFYAVQVPLANISLKAKVVK